MTSYQDEEFYASSKEISSMRPLISSFIQKTVGSKQESIEGIVIDCLVRRLDLKEMKKTLDKHLPNGTSSKLIDIIVDDVNQSRNQLKRKHQQDEKSTSHDNGNGHDSNNESREDEEYKKRSRGGNDDDSTSKRRISRERDGRSYDSRDSRAGRSSDRDYRDRDRERDDRYRDERHRDDRFRSDERYRDERHNSSRDERDRYSRDDRYRSDDRYSRDERSSYNSSSSSRDERDRGGYRDEYRDSRDRDNRVSSRQSPSSPSSAAPRDSPPRTRESNDQQQQQSNREIFTNGSQKQTTSSNANSNSTSTSTNNTSPSSTTTPTSSTSSEQQSDELIKQEKIRNMKARLEARKVELQQQQKDTSTITTTITTTSTTTTIPTTTTTTDETSSTTKMEIEDEKSIYFDPRLEPKQKKKKTLEGFNMVTKPGKFSRKADRIRMQQLQAELMKKDITTQSVLTKSNYITPDVPIMEWWDRDILVQSCTTYQQIIGTDTTTSSSSMQIDNQLNTSLILELDQWIYIKHPVIINAPLPTVPPPQLNLVPHIKERKKMRRMRRAEEQKLKRDRVICGLDPPPPNRVKMNNLMRVLTTQAVLDPTQMIEQVRADADQRAREHEQRNADAKLTPDQRREKKDQKVQVDAARELRCILFRVNSIAHPLHRAKIDKMARQWIASGCAVESAGMCIVVIEGGAKAIKKYRKLMERRIDWANPPPAKSEVTDPRLEQIANQRSQMYNGNPPPNSCQTIWEGPITQANFKYFQIETCQNESQARKFLSDHNVPHFWDMAKNYIDSNFI